MIQSKAYFWGSQYWAYKYVDLDDLTHWVFSKSYFLFVQRRRKIGYNPKLVDPTNPKHGFRKLPKIHMWKFTKIFMTLMEWLITWRRFWTWPLRFPLIAQCPYALHCDCCQSAITLVSVPSFYWCDCLPFLVMLNMSIIMQDRGLIDFREACKLCMLKTSQKHIEYILNGV